MAMTAVEKILARAAGKERVEPGEIVYPVPDLVFVHDGYAHTLDSELEELGVQELFDSSKLVMVTDHDVLYTSTKAAQRGLGARNLVERFGVEQFYDVGRNGLGHVFPVELGMVAPGMFVFAYDMHCTNYGSIGALALRNGTEVVSVVATGTVWTKVPSTIRLTLRGELAPGVYPRDLSAVLARELANGSLGVETDYRAIEMVGPALERFGVDARMTLCNSPTEMGVATVFIPPSAELVKRWEQTHGRVSSPIYSDDDSGFEAQIDFDVSSVRPQVAKPPSPDNLVDISELEGMKIQHAVIGSCASGLYEDMAVAAAILKNRTVAASVRLFITPATQDIYRRCLDEGFIDIFQCSGAILTPPGCGPCAGGKIGALAPGEVSIGTVTQNHPGRLGARDAQIYLASPATVAASAVKGEIADARELL